MPEDVYKRQLIVNVNPGCYFGGSATQYFIGDFDGEKFVCDNKPETVKWLDWGKAVSYTHQMCIRDSAYMVDRIEALNAQIESQGQIVEKYKKQLDDAIAAL